MNGNRVEITFNNNKDVVILHNVTSIGFDNYSALDCIGRIEFRSNIHNKGAVYAIGELSGFDATAEVAMNEKFIHYAD